MRPQMHQNLHKNSVFPVQLYTGITVQWDPGATQGDPGVTQVWPRVTQGWPRGNPGVTQGQCFLGVKLGQPRGNVGATRGQSLLGLPPGRPWVTSGLPPSCPGSLPSHPGTEQQSCTVQQAFFFAWLFAFLGFNKSVCEINYPSVICNNTFDYIRRYGRSAGFSRWHLRYHKLKNWIFFRKK